MNVKALCPKCGQDSLRCFATFPDDSADGHPLERPRKRLYRCGLCGAKYLHDIPKSKLIKVK